LIPTALGVLMDVMLVTHHPAAPLASYVEALWYYEGSRLAAHKERVLPNGRFQLVVNLSAAAGAVAGVRSQYVVIDPAAMESMIGVLFRPNGPRHFFDAPASAFYNQVVPLDAVWGSQSRALRDRLVDAPAPREKFLVLEDALRKMMRTGAQDRFALHPSVQYALRQFRRMPHIQTVMNVAREAGLSRRRFSQLFDEQVGVTPKLYCRLIRFRQVVWQIAAGGPVDWADVALAGGYYDQAHLAHEFRDFSGMSPSSFLAAERPFANHVRV
jgi:AraC-like DNA-binding protein